MESTNNQLPRTKEYGGKTYTRLSVFPSRKPYVDIFKKQNKGKLKIHTVSVGSKSDGERIYFIYTRSIARDK